MLRHFLTAALRNLAATRLQSAIAILGLAIGIWAAVLDGLVIVNQYSFDSFIPGSPALYQVIVNAGINPVTGAAYGLDTPHDIAALARQHLRQVRDTTRFDGNFLRLRHGEIESKEVVYWADANFFRLLPMPVLYGDASLARPDAIVIPLSIARKYFGRDDVVGQALEIDRKHVMTVAAVIADLPQNASNFESAIFASGKAAFSAITRADAKPPMGTNGRVWFDVQTVLQLAPGTDAGTLEEQLRSLVKARVHLGDGEVGLKLVRRDRLRVSPDLMPRVRTSLAIVSAMALLVLALASLNFVNLSTARAARRSVEVGIRKAVGASRAMLALQFLGETVVQALLALCVAVMLVELSLPVVNVFLETGATFQYWRDPGLVFSLTAGTVMLGMMAGVYPALLLSSFRPALVLKGLMSGGTGAGVIRQILVALQFIILILMVATSLVFLAQYRFSMRDALRVDTDQMLFVRDQKCESPFEAAVRSLPGVRGAACSSTALLPELMQVWDAKVRGGKQALHLISSGYGLFEIYGLRPVAGRFFTRDHGGDAVSPDPGPAVTAHYVINETAARKLGFASPAAAVGQPLIFDQPPLGAASTQPRPAPAADPEPVEGTNLGVSNQGERHVLDGVIIGVVRDFSLFPTDRAIEPTAYSVGWPVLLLMPKSTLIHLKLRGDQIPETLAAIDRLWRSTGADTPIERSFLDAHIQEFVIAILRQGQAFGIFAGLAVLLACLGLFALSIATAERRTKEIGIRKAMGASNGDIVGMLLWQFLRPVLGAGLIAVPLAWWLMQRWLSGYAYHVSPGPWPFLAAALLAVLIALATVITHAILTARAVPAMALRYE